MDRSKVNFVTYNGAIYFPYQHCVQQSCAMWQNLMYNETAKNSNVFSLNTATKTFEEI